MYRHRFIENNQMYVSYNRRPTLRSIIQNILLFFRRSRRRPMWQARDLHGNALDAPRGLVVCSPNNWLRSIGYKLGVPRKYLRKV